MCKNTLKEKDGTLITIAAVFIGIYFTVFTFLSSIKVESTFTILEKHNFGKLLNYIRNAFIGSFIYLFYSLFSALFLYEWINVVITLILLLYMLLSALRFGTIVYTIFRIDINKFYKEIEEDKERQKKLDNLIRQLSIFLNDQEELKQEKRTDDFEKELKDKQSRNFQK